MPNDNREEVVYGALVTLLTDMTNPAFKRVHKTPPAVSGFATPAAWVWLMSSTGRHGPRADNAKKWRFELAVRMVAPIDNQSTPEKTFAQMRTQFENALDGSSKLGGKAHTIQTGEWKYLYEGTEQTGVSVGIETVVTFTWLNIPAGSN